MAMAPSGGQGQRSPYQSDGEYADYGTNGHDQFNQKGPRAQGFDPRQMQGGFDQRQRGTYYNEEQAHFGPPGTGPLPGDPYYCDDRYYNAPGSGPPDRGGRGSAMTMQDSGYRGAGGGGGGGGAIPPEFEDDGYGVTSFSDEDADELDLRQDIFFPFAVEAVECDHG